MLVFACLLFPLSSYCHVWITGVVVYQLQVNEEVFDEDIVTTSAV